MTENPESTDGAGDISPSPLQYEVTDKAKQEIRDATRWLMNVSPEAALRLDDRLQEEMDGLCNLWGQGFRFSPDEAASLHFS